MLRSTTALLTAVVVAGLTAACDVKSERAFDLGVGDEYVALGDSYTAAPGAGEYDGSDGCLRSATNYPHQIADATGMTLRDVSCTAATSEALVEPFPTPAGNKADPQLDALSTSTDLVTVGIGANDYNLIGTVFLTCVGLAAEPDAGDSPCADADRTAGGSTTGRLLERMEANVDDRLAEIERRAPDAEVVVVGYPQIVPETGTCDLLPLAPGDYPFARELLDGINEALEEAADRAGVDFLDLVPGSEGHDICSDDPWIAGAEAVPGKATPWHPFPEEQELVRELILLKL